MSRGRTACPASSSAGLSVGVVRQARSEAGSWAPARLTEALEDAARHDETSLPEIARHASPDCRVDDLQGIAGETWRALASAQRFPPTFANIAAYAAHFGIDDSLAVTLTADPKIQDHKAAAAPEKEALAIAILNAGAALSDPAVRVQLVLSLDLAGQIEQARALGILSEYEAQFLAEYDRKVMDIVNVDDFETHELGTAATEQFSEPPLQRKSGDRS